MEALLGVNCSGQGDFCPGYDCISSDPDFQRVFFYDGFGSLYQEEDGISLYNACNCTSFHKDTHHGVSSVRVRVRLPDETRYHTMWLGSDSGPFWRAYLSKSCLQYDLR